MPNKDNDLYPVNEVHIESYIEYSKNHKPQEVKKWERVKELMKPGLKIRLRFEDGNINNKLMHIRAIIDGSVIVYCTWSKRHQNWRYEIENPYFFLYNLEYLTVV